jgi:hypothetical protein
VAANSSRPVIAIAATDRQSLRPLLEKIGEMLSRDIGLSPYEEPVAADLVSRIA